MGKVEIRIKTRLENEDNLTISKLINLYVKPKTVVTINSIGDTGIVIITFVTGKGRCLKAFERDLSLLNYIGIEGKIMV